MRHVRVLVGAIKRLDWQVLLDPFEKQFDLPALAVQVYNQLGFEGDVVSQKRDALASVVLDHHASQRCWIVLAGINDGQHILLIAHDVRVSPVCGAGITPLEFGIGLGTDDEERVGLIDHKQSLEIQVSTIEQVISARLYVQQVQDVDHPDQPKVEDKIGKPLSLYDFTKLVNELYAEVFGKSYRFKNIGLRYFNIFGRRQDPDGAYAAVIPKWIAAMIKKELVYVNGDAETSRDFCYIENTVQANLLTATVSNEDASNKVYNVAVGDRIGLNQLYSICATILQAGFHTAKKRKPVHRVFRSGNIYHSLADIWKGKILLSYKLTSRIRGARKEAMAWNIDFLNPLPK